MFVIILLNETSLLELQHLSDEIVAKELQLATERYREGKYGKSVGDGPKVGDVRFQVFNLPCRPLHGTCGGGFLRDGVSRILLAADIGHVASSFCCSDDGWSCYGEFIDCLVNGVPLFGWKQRRRRPVKSAVLMRVEKGKERIIKSQRQTNDRDPFGRPPVSVYKINARRKREEEEKKESSEKRWLLCLRRRRRCSISSRSNTRSRLPRKLVAIVGVERSPPLPIESESRPSSSLSQMKWK